MSPGHGEHDPAGGMRFGGEVTGRVQAGRFVLEVGFPAGMRADFAPGQATDATALRIALSQPESPGALAAAEEAVEDLGSVASKIERSLELFTALAQGKILDRKIFLKEVDVLLGALERLDREGRHRDALRLARALAAVLALAMRWVALVESLRLTLRAARALGDSQGIAWARHELGTLFLGADDAAAANAELRESLRIREEIGDEAGAEVTRHNLAALRQAFGPDEGGGTGPRPAVVAAIVVGVLLLAALGVGIALAVRDGDDGPPAADTTAPEVSITDAPENPTEEQSASFAFEADEEVQRFECRLDDGSFEECVSPQNVVGPLATGAHVFAVRAADLAGNVGEAAIHEWTIEAGEGPRAVILDGPDELTNQTEARFTIDAPGATRLECSLDGGDAEECRALAVFEVDEGEHTFEVRGFAGDTPGPPARYRWTVDATPPSFEISVAGTGTGSATLEFGPSEDLSRVECRLTQDGVEVSLENPPPCESPIAYDGLGLNESYVFEVLGTDFAGNQGRGEEPFETGGVER